MRTTLTILGAIGLFPVVAHSQPAQPAQPDQPAQPSGSAAAEPTAFMSAPEPLPAPSAAAGEHMTMPAKRLVLRTHLEVNLSDGTAFEPTSLAPDLWYGVNDDLTVGLVHSAAGGSGVMGGSGSSLCLTGTSGGCSEVYRGFGVDARYQVHQGTLSIAADGGLFINHFDPFLLALKLGAVGRWRPSAGSKLAIDVAPNLFLGLTERASGNKEVLSVPATVLYDLAPKISLAAQTGVVLPFSKTGDTFAIPLSLGASYQLSYRISLDAAFSLPALLGGDALATGFDSRSITLGGGYAF